MRFLRRTTVIVPCLLFLLLQLGCGDQYRPIANPIVGPGGQPQRSHFAYVVSYNASGSGSNTKINVSGDTNVQVVTTGLGSIAEAFQGSVQGAIFVANRDSDSVSEFAISSTGTAIAIALYPALASASTVSPASIGSRRTTTIWAGTARFLSQLC